MIVPTGAKTTTRTAASRTMENVSQLRPTITFSVSAARRASSGTRQRSFATTRPIGANGKETERLSDSSAPGVGVGLRMDRFLATANKAKLGSVGQEGTTGFEGYWLARRSLGPL